MGSDQVLGSWDLSQGPELQWGDGDEWSLDIDIPAGQQLSFKVRSKLCAHNNCSGDDVILYGPSNGANGRSKE